MELGTAEVGIFFLSGLPYKQYTIAASASKTRKPEMVPAIMAMMRLDGTESEAETGVESEMELHGLVLIRCQVRKG